MKKKILIRKALAISILFTFVQITLSSPIASDRKQTTPNIEHVEDCGCAKKTDSRICDILWNRITSIRDIAMMISNLSYKFFNYPILYRLLAYAFKITVLRGMPLILLGEYLKCNWTASPDGLTFTDTSEIPHHVKSNVF